MNIFITFIIGLICGVLLYVLLDRAYGLWKRAGRELVTMPETDAREREGREVECCGGAHPPPPPPPPRPCAYLSPSAPVRARRVRPR
ncbi:MAG TPA: hypothetical protein VEY11_19685 [Pyrinomonadaceae bacterium]|nr:hypothetical protein [Pyrinomonadaceae bacterium]